MPHRPDQCVFDEVVKRTVTAKDPVRIIVLGSAARGTMEPDSALDLPVVVRDGIHRRRTAQAVYAGVRGIGFAKDVIVGTESDVREFGGNLSLVICPALRQGKETCHAAG